MSISGDDREISDIQKDLLWGLYQDVRTHARHAETLRTSAVNYMMVIAVALITLITFDKRFSLSDLPLSIVVCLIGLFTALFSASYAELYFRNRERAKGILKRLDELLFDNRAQNTLTKLVDDAEEEGNPQANHYRYQWARKISGSTHLFWVGLPAVVFVVGVLLIYMSVVGLTIE